MSDFTDLLLRNDQFADGTAHVGLAPTPTHQVLIVTCIDARVDPAYLLGLELGDALVVRNAGGRVTREVIDEITFIAQLTETMFGDDAPAFEVAVIHHTGCGSGLLADPNFRRRYSERIGAREEDVGALAVVDPRESVRDDLQLLSRAGLPERIEFSGHVYDVETGRITTVTTE